MPMHSPSSCPDLLLLYLLCCWCYSCWCHAVVVLDMEQPTAWPVQVVKWGRRQQLGSSMQRAQLDSTAGQPQTAAQQRLCGLVPGTMLSWPASWQQWRVCIDRHRQLAVAAVNRQDGRQVHQPAGKAMCCQRLSLSAPSTARFYWHTQRSHPVVPGDNFTGAGGLWTCSYSQAGGLRMRTRSGSCVCQQVAPVQGQPAILEFHRCTGLNQTT
jgi:hypothetical protein